MPTTPAPMSRNDRYLPSAPDGTVRGAPGQRERLRNRELRLGNSNSEPGNANSELGTRSQNWESRTQNSNGYRPAVPQSTFPRRSSVVEVPQFKFRVLSSNFSVL